MCLFGTLIDDFAFSRTEMDVKTTLMKNYCPKNCVSFNVISFMKEIIY